MSINTVLNFIPIKRVYFELGDWGRVELFFEACHFVIDAKAYLTMVKVGQRTLSFCKNT